MFWPKNTKKGVDFKIVGFGDRHIETLLADYDGTLSRFGEVADDVKQRLLKLSEMMDVHILTGDRHVKANDSLGKVPINIHLLSERWICCSIRIRVQQPCDTRPCCSGAL